MNLGFPLPELNPNEYENPSDFGFAKNVRIRQCSDLDSDYVSLVCVNNMEHCYLPHCHLSVVVRPHLLTQDAQWLG